jgi:hypothetical protein
MYLPTGVRRNHQTDSLNQDPKILSLWIAKSSAFRTDLKICYPTGGKVKLWGREEVNIMIHLNEGWLLIPLVLFAVLSITCRAPLDS